MGQQPLPPLFCGMSNKIFQWRFPFMTLLFYKSDNTVIIIAGLLFFEREFRAHASTCVGQQILVQPAALGHTQQNSNFTLNRTTQCALLMAALDGPGQRLASGWTVQGSNTGGGETLLNLLDRLQDPPSLLYNGYRGTPRGKAAETWRWLPTKVKERVELYLCSPCGPWWAVLGVNVRTWSADALVLIF